MATQKDKKQAGAGRDVKQFVEKLSDIVSKLPPMPDRIEEIYDPLTVEEGFEGYFRSNPAVQLLADPVTGTFVDANNAACEFYGYSYERIRGMRVSEVSTLDFESSLHNMHMAITLEQRIFNFRHRMADGRVRDVEVYAQPVVLFERPLILMTIMDVTNLAYAWKVQALLLEIAEAASVTDDLYHLIYMIRDRLHGFLDTSNFIVALYESSGGEYSFPFVADELDLVPEEGPHPGSLIDYVRRTGRPILVDPEMFSALSKRAEVKPDGHNAKCWLGVPLRTSIGVIGVVAALNYSEPAAYSDADLELLEFISGSIASTIERRKIEEALRESEKRFRTFVNRSPDGIYSLDLREPIPVDLPHEEQSALIRENAYFSECNETFYRIYGLSSEEELIGASLYDLPASYGEGSTATVEKLVENRYRVTEGESFELLPDGEQKIYFNQFLGIVQEGKLIRIWGVQRDITERKRAEQDLHIQQFHLTRFIENSTEGILFTDTTDKIISVNKAFIDMFGFSYEELHGKPNDKIVPHGREEESRKLIEAAEKNQPVSLETLRKRKDGKLIHVNVMGTPIHLDGKLSGTYWVYRDISQRKRSELVQTALFHIAEAANTSADLDELLKIVHDQLSRLIDTTNLYVALYDQERDSYSFAYFVDEKEELDQRESYNLPNSMTDYIRLHGSALFTSEEELNEHLKKSGITPAGPLSKSWLGVPLRTPTSVIGVYVVQSYTEPNAYDETDMELLEFVSGHIATAIEHQRWQDQLLASEARYRTLFNQSPVGVLLYDLDMKVVDLNQRHADIMGATREELLELDLTQVRQRNVVPLMRRTLRGERTFFEGTYVTTHHEKELWLSISLSPHHGATGEIIGGIAVVMDQTEQKKTERIAEMNRAYLEQLFEGAPEAIVMLDPRFRAIRANREFTQLFGFQSDEVLGRSLQDLILTEDEEADLHLDALKAVVRGETVAVDEGVCRRKDNTRVDVSLLGTPIEIDGQVIALYAIYRDITSRIQATEALAAEKDRLAVTLASIGEGVLTTDLQGRVQLMNEAAEQLTGWTADQARNRDLGTIFVLYDLNKEEKLQSPAEFVLSGDEVDVTWSREAVMRTRKGEEKTIIGSASPIHGGEGNVIGSVVVFRDISAQRALEEELQKIERLESVGVLAGGIAHDFNNILSAVLGNISLAKMSGENPTVQSERLHEAEKAALRARDLTQQLLTFSRGGEPIRKSQSIVEIIHESTTFALRGSNVKSRTDIAEDLWPAEVDEGQIGRVINNLVINADQAMPEGGTITIVARNVEYGEEGPLPLQPGKYVQVTVSDEGVGIPEEYQQRIFDPFFTTKQRGSGLGLASSFSIVQKHGGHIMVESQVGRGTSFNIWLPASDHQATRSQSKTSGEFTGSGRVLVMDDEKVVREVVRAMLERLGFEVEEAEDGLKAIEIYQKARMVNEPFRAVIMDLTIPGGMGGAEAISHLKKLDPNIVAIVSSGYSNDMVMSNYEEHGFKGVVAKPFKLEELSQVLGEVLE